MLEGTDWALLRALAGGQPRAVTRWQLLGGVLFLAGAVACPVGFVLTVARLWGAWRSGSAADAEAALAAVPLSGETIVLSLVGLSIALPPQVVVGAAALGAAAAADDDALAPLAAEPPPAPTESEEPTHVPRPPTRLPWPREVPRQTRTKGLVACLTIFTFVGLLLFLEWALAIEPRDPSTWWALLLVLGSVLVLTIAGMEAVWCWTSRSHGVHLEAQATGVRWREPGLLRRWHHATWDEFRAVCRVPFSPWYPPAAPADPCIAYVVVRAKHGLIWQEPLDRESAPRRQHQHWLALLVARTGLPVRDVSAPFLSLRLAAVSGGRRKPEVETVLRALAAYVPMEGFAPLRAELAGADRHQITRRLFAAAALSYLVLGAATLLVLHALGG